MSKGRDPKGYYFCLGVTPNASSEEIKSSYKLLAKKLHPDISRDPNAKAQFQRINEAYGILSNPDSRSTYDALQYSQPAPEPSRDELDPICCSHCGKVTAQPRSTVFYQVVSLILLTTKTPIQGIFCSSCATKKGLKASLISALFGWWGFPWGPIWTISSICNNAAGGRHSQEIDEKLTWYNALAFMSRGKLAISYALAQQSLKARSAEIAAGADKLINHLRAIGVPATSPSLKNPWLNPMLAIGHIGLLLLIPGAVGLAVAYDDLTKGAKQPYARQPYTPTPQQTYVPTLQTAPKPDFSQLATATPMPPRVAEPIPTCANPPNNGRILTRNIMLGTKGHSIEIKNGTSANALIKIRDAMSGALKLSFFVQKGLAASVSDLPDGYYRIQYAFGEELGVNCRDFAQTLSASQFPEPKNLTTEHTATQFFTHRLSYTLYSVPGGNVRPQPLDLAAFNAD